MYCTIVSLIFSFPSHAEPNPIAVVVDVATSSTCGWCEQKEKPNSYVLPLKNGRHIFCSESCLIEFKKHICFLCGETISGTSVQSFTNLTSREFCSQECLEKYRKREQNKQPNISSSTPISFLDDTNNPSASSVVNSNNVPSLILGGNPSLSFSWDDYLRETASLAAPQVCFKQVQSVNIN